MPEGLSCGAAVPPHSFQGFTYIAGHPRIALHQQLCGPCPTGQPIEPGGDHTAGKGPRKIGGELLPLTLFSLGLPMAFQSPWAGGLILAAALLRFGCRRAGGRPRSGGVA